MAMKSKLVTTAMAGVLALGLGAAGQANADADMKNGMEKCYGVAKAGKNDCGTKAHSCAAQATKDGDNNEWVMVPKGTCDKIVGGSTSRPDESDKADKADKSDDSDNSNDSDE